MIHTGSWTRGVVLRGNNLSDLLTSTLQAGGKRRTCLIAGAGFDPRARAACRLLNECGASPLHTYLLREERPDPAPELRKRADANLAEMLILHPNSEVINIQIFAQDGAVIAGREATRFLANIPLDDHNDVFLDISALSTGVFYPTVKYLYEWACADSTRNLHLLLTEEPAIDRNILGVACDMPASLHGFKGRLGLDESANAAKLWLPQLVPNQRMTLNRIYNHIEPDDVCPVLPFPSRDPRQPDRLIEEYREELRTWNIDFRNLVLAAEDDPLDLYRSILRIQRTRERVFGTVMDSLIVLSPLGSKVLAVGALLAAIELDLPVALIESLSYEVNFPSLDQSSSTPAQVVHIWLAGDPYRKQPSTAITSPKTA